MRQTECCGEVTVVRWMKTPTRYHHDAPRTADRFVIDGKWQCRVHPGHGGTWRTTTDDPNGYA